MIPYVFLNDIGTLIKVDVGSDVSLATAHLIKYVKPDGDEGEWDATVSTRYLQYVTTDGDLDQLGQWQVQAKVQTPSGTWHGEVTRFEVQKPLFI
jgi:hypothetical protein